MRHIENGNIHSDHFDSLMEFVHYIETAPTNKEFERKYGTNLHSKMSVSQNTDKYMYEWYGCTSNFEEAQKLMQNGYADGLKAILKADGKVRSDRRPIRRDDNDYMGYRPNVQRYLQGMPNSMVRRYTEYNRGQVIKIYYDCAVAAEVKGNTLAIAGKNMMTLIRHYEQNHCNVELHLISVSEDDMLSSSMNRIAGLTIKIKDAKQHLNPMLISYPVTHPAFFRRHILRWKEVSECTDTKYFPSGYGRQIRYELQRGCLSVQTWLRDHNLIPQNGHYLCCEDIANAESLQDILDLIEDGSSGNKVHAHSSRVRAKRRAEKPKEKSRLEK